LEKRLRRIRRKRRSQRKYGRQNHQLGKKKLGGVRLRKGLKKGRKRRGKGVKRHDVETPRGRGMGEVVLVLSMPAFNIKEKKELKLR